MKELGKFTNSCDCISRSHLLSEIEKLKRSPWYNNPATYAIRCDAVGVIERLCIRDEPHIMPQCFNEAEEADCDHFVCSHCGIDLSGWTQITEELKEDCPGDGMEYVFQYCPNCGAEIVERKE